jgi:hypothetical protein
MGFWSNLADFFYIYNRPLGRRQGRASDADYFGWEFPCPWPECGFSLTPYWAAEQYVKVCPACGRPIWWAKEGTEPRRVEEHASNRVEEHASSVEGEKKC